MEDGGWRMEGRSEKREAGCGTREPHISFLASRLPLLTSKYIKE